VHDLGLTVVLAEHRLERVVQYADRVVRLTEDGGIIAGDPATVLATSPVVPPVVELGRLAGWAPLPLTIRDARRQAGSLRTALELVAPPGADPSSAPTAGSAAPDGSLVQVRGITVRHGSRAALRDVSLQVSAGEVVAVMGRNGAGKSSLLATMVGLLQPDRGSVQVGGAVPHALNPSELLRRVGLVPQESADLLFAETVEQECRAADGDARAPAGTTAALLAQFTPDLDTTAHPRDLSEGQRLTLVLAIVLAADPSVLLLDEPTRGLDYPTKRRLVEILRARSASGTAVILATHDVELVAEVAGRVVVLAVGEIVADGPTAEIVISSPAFAPQVAKILAPQPWLTVAAVAAALPVAG
jgi:energy-coupling factor transport system ATP-binding protein